MTESKYEDMKARCAHSVSNNHSLCAVVRLAGMTGFTSCAPSDGNLVDENRMPVPEGDGVDTNWSRTYGSSKLGGTGMLAASKGTAARKS